MTVMGGAGSIVAGGAAELGHRYKHGILGQISQIIPKRGDRLRELAEKVRKLSLSVAFVHMVVPAADIGKGYLDAQISFEQLRDLAQTVTKASAGIVRSGCRRVARRICRLQHLNGFECLLTGAVQHAVDGLCVHRFERVTDWCCIRISSANAKIADVADGDGRELSGKGSRQ